MIWVLLVAALAAHVSGQAFRYTGTVVVTREEFCKHNKYYPQNCDQNFERFLDSRPDLQQCGYNSPVYSNFCTNLPYAAATRPNPPQDTEPNVLRVPPPSAGYDVDKRFDNSPYGVDRNSMRNRDATAAVPYGVKVMNFALNLFQKSLPNDDSSNYILSPIMVQSLLSYLTDGASNDARQEMETVLQLNTNDLEDISQALQHSSSASHIYKYKLDAASQIFKSSRINLLTDFQSSLKTKKIPLEEMDFSNRGLAAQNINDWVAQKTRQRILSVVDENSLDPETKLFLLNAIYFNGTWMWKFNKTERSKFYLNNDNKQMSVNMMFLTEELRNGNTRPAGEPGGLTWVELPYDGDRLSMILFLPNERYQLNEALRTLSLQDLKTVMNDIRLDEPGKVRLQLPEFQAESTISLVEPLKRMGLSSIFGDQHPFDKVSRDQVKISDVKQKSFLGVNQYGTVATSVTIATVIPLSITHTLDFKADQPFALMIMDKHKQLPLFFAKITQPNKWKTGRS